MEQSIFLVKENSCKQLEYIDEEWDAVNQPIICYLNSVGINVYRGASAKRLYKNMPLEICRIANIEPFFYEVVEKNERLILTNISVDYSLVNYKDSIIKSMASICNLFLQEEKIAVLTINRKVLFFKATTVFLNELLIIFKKTNDTYIKSSLFETYTLEILEYNFDKKDYPYGEKNQTAYISANPILEVKEEITQSLIVLEDLEFDFLYQPFVEELKKNKISSIYNYSLDYYKKATISRFFSEIEDKLNLAKGTFLFIEDSNTIIIDKREHKITLSDENIFALINKYLRGVGRIERIYYFYSCYEQNIFTLKYNMVECNVGFVLISDEIGQYINKELEKCYAAFKAQSFQSNKIVNRIIEFCNLDANINFNWTTALHQKNIPLENKTFEAWKPKYEDWDEGLGRLGITVWQLNYQIMDKPAFVHELLIKTELKDRIQYQIREYDNGLKHIFCINNEFYEDIRIYNSYYNQPIENTILSKLNSILLENGEKKQFYLIYNQYLVFTKVSYFMKLFLKVYQFDMNVRYRAGFLGNLYRKIQLPFLKLCNIFLWLHWKTTPKS